MSGYLHRIASRVLNSQSAIHPFVGTLWASPRNAEPFESVAEIAAQPAASRRAQTPVPPLAQSLRIESNLEDESRSESTLHHAPMHSSETELLAKSVQPLISHVTPSVQSQQQRTEDATVESVHAEQKKYLQPLIAPISADSSQLLIESLAAATLIPSQARPQQRQPLPAPPTREPDEIEIHIGRIEVIAAQPQPAPRVQPQAPRKSLDLGEYLRRGRAQ